MVNYSAVRLSAAGAAILLMITGCGKQDWGHLNGTVTVNGDPVGPGKITLRPIDIDRPGAVAYFGEDGKYTVVSSGRKEGARIGEYRLFIHGGEDFGVEEADLRRSSNTKIPVAYSSSRTSDLTVTIESGTKTVDFDLKP